MVGIREASLRGLTQRLGIYASSAAMVTLGLSAPALAAPGNGNGTPPEQAVQAQSNSADAPGQVKKEASTQNVSVQSTGANSGCGNYCPTPSGPSMNGNGGGNATGRPDAGSVGNADSKNPPGQYPDGSDKNKGYECDKNHGIGRGNPAHTGCQPTVASGKGGAGVVAAAAPATVSPAQGAATLPATGVTGLGQWILALLGGLAAYVTTRRLQLRRS